MSIEVAWMAGGAVAGANGKSLLKDDIEPAYGCNDDEAMRECESMITSMLGRSRPVEGENAIVHGVIYTAIYISACTKTPE